jgi:beta-lactamase class A
MTKLSAVPDQAQSRRAADLPAHAASLVKVPLATAAEAVDLERRVEVHADFASVAGGRFTIEREDDQDEATWDALGGTETLCELRRRSIVESSNIATNLLLEVVGVPAVQDVLRAAGVSASTTFTRGIGDLAGREAGLANEVTARDLGRVLAHTPTAVEEIMLGQRYRDGIPAGLPAGTRVANKTGWVDGITHDMAIVRPTDGAAFALAVLTRSDDDHETAEKRIAAIAAEAWERRR